ncbi:MAG: RNA polymerase sigma factor [Phaeodactylibacter sp.]|nr:RNA polymerase sigma factor [Phaeodactylibacter sp.]MCB9266115.1 RNA polymerase sigma factor [Lewinellaceae bacterium]MCB9289259.1 RNA polymerase sigma factor [Lewinellaceae bacterium]
MHAEDASDLRPVLMGCRKRQRGSQHELYRHFYAYGMSITIRYADNEDEAIQILNDSFMKVFSNIKKFDLEKPFKPWFRKIVVNTAINYVRKQKKFKREVQMDEAGNISTGEDILSRISYMELMAMVQSLTTAYRTVFNMYVIDGFKHEEIANMLGISVGASKSNLSKARSKLREMIQKNLNTRYA